MILMAHKNPSEGCGATLGMADIFIYFDLLKQAKL